MKQFIVAIIAILILVLPSANAIADGLEPIGSEEAKQLAKRLCEEAAKVEKPQIKIEPDAEKANGLHSPGKVGLMIVPQKDLKEGEELAAKFKTDKGASLAFLFLYNLAPVIDGKTVDASKLRSLKFTDNGGTEHTVHVLLLAVRQLSEDDYRLQAYGHDEKPLIESKFSEGEKQGPEPIGVDVKEVNEQTRQGKLIVTVFGKYKAEFQCGHKVN